MGALWTKKAIIAVLVLVPLTLGVGGLLAQRSDRSNTLVEVPTGTKTSHSKSTSSPAISTSNDETIGIKGRVLDPDGKPFAGASLFLLADFQRKNLNVSVRATSDNEGGFHIKAKPKDFDSKGKAILAVRADGFGPNWTEITANSKDPITLPLVKDDVPIEGRVLDLEGRPVVDAKIRLLKLHQTDLDQWLMEAKRGRWYFPPDIPEALAVRVATGRDGRFQLRGLGRDRLLYLEISGDTIERVHCWTMTRAKMISGLSGGHEPVYNATFHHIAGPTKPIVGTVREKSTGKPLAGISVQMERWINNAKTDEHGRYQIIGNAKQREYGMTAAGRPYFIAIKRHIADTAGFEPLVVDFELERGIEIRGRVVNRKTGEPIKADVEYHSLADNPYLKKGSSLDQENINGRNQTTADGSFFVVGLPGPGLLTVLASEDDYLKPERPAEWKRLVPYVNLAPPRVHAWVRINPSENDPESTYCEIALEPAKPIPGEMRGPDGKPMSGCFIAGLTGSPMMHSYQLELHERSSFRVRGVDPGRPRTVIFLHPKKKLGKVEIVQADQPRPLQVRLEPLGGLVGRVLDAEGRPQVGLQVRARLGRKDDNFLPTMFQFEEGLREYQLDPLGKTDAGGKFRLDGLMPGLNYTLLVTRGETDSDPIVVARHENVMVQSGKTRDLGDLKSKQAPEK
jgi:hypothetical protein